MEAMVPLVVEKTFCRSMLIQRTKVASLKYNDKGQQTEGCSGEVTKVGIATYFGRRPLQ